MSINLSPNANSVYRAPIDGTAAPQPDAGDDISAKLAAHLSTDRDASGAELNSLLCQAKTAIWNTTLSSTPTETKQLRAIALDAIQRVQNEYPNWQENKRGFECPPPRTQITGDNPPVIGTTAPTT